MTDFEIRNIEMYVRVRDFGVANPQPFSPDEPGGKWFGTFKQSVTELQRHAAAQVSGTGSARQAASLKAAASKSLWHSLDRIRLTARALTDDIPALKDKFRIPGSPGLQKLLNTAYGFVDDVEPFAPAFIEHNMPADFVEQLKEEIANLERAVTSRGEGRKKHSLARVGIRQSMRQAAKALRHMAAFVVNAYHDDPFIMRAWEQARHVERAWQVKPSAAKQAASKAADPKPEQPAAPAVGGAAP